MDNQQLEHLLRKIDELVTSQGKMSGTMAGLTSNARKASSSTVDTDYAASFMKSAKGLSVLEGAADDLAVTFSKASGTLLGVMTGDLKNLQGAIQSSIRGISNALGFGGMGGVLASSFGGLTDIAGSMVSNFQTLSDSGKDFSGGIMNMATAAFESGKTISEYTEYMHKNSLTAAAMADKNGGLGALASKVRNAGIQFGEFGYSISQLDDLTAQYAERRRATGSMEQLDNLNVHTRVLDLARDTNALSKAFGVSREQLTKDTTNAIKGNPFLVGNTNKGIETLMTGIMAGGPMGAALAKLASMGSEFGMLSDEYRDLVSTGPMGQKLGDMVIRSSDYAAANPKDAYMESIRLNNEKVKMANNKEEMHNLKYLALTNKAAADLLSELGQAHYIDPIKAKRDHDSNERIDAITLALESAGVSWSNTIASFSLGATSGLKKLFDNFQDPKFSEPLKNLMGPGGPITKFGERFGAWVGELFNADRITQVTNWINGLFDPEGIKKANTFIDGLFNGKDYEDAKQFIIDEIKSMIGKETVAEIKAIIDNVSIITGIISSALTELSKVLSSMGITVGNITEGLLATWVAFKVAAVGKGLWDFGSKIAGAGAAVLGLGGKAAAGAGVAGAGAVAEGAAAAGAAGAAKMAGIAIPVIGDVLQGYLAYHESGDWKRGVTTGIGSLGGRAAIGLGTGGLGELAGSFAGAELAKHGYDAVYGAPNATPNVPGQATSTVTSDHPATASLLGNLAQTTQDALSPALGAMADSISGDAESTNDKQTDALVKQLEAIKKIIVVQTEVMAGLINDLSGTIKIGNDSLSTISKRGN